MKECKRMLVHIAVILFLIFHDDVIASPTGAPSLPEVCNGLFPRHNFSAQTSPSPYQISVSTSTYDLNQEITVTLSAGGGIQFRGFVLQARRVADNSSIGTFRNITTDVKLTCLNFNNATITHTDRNDKNTISAIWKAPADLNFGNIFFQATVVKNYSQIWSGLFSTIIASNSTLPEQNITTTTTAAPVTIVPQPQGNDVDISSCGKTKSCLRQGCTTKCHFVVTWKDNGNVVDYEMSTDASSDSRYVSTGISTDQKMGSDTVIDCIQDPSTGRVNVALSQNGAGSTRFNDALDDSIFQLISRLPEKALLFISDFCEAQLPNHSPCPGITEYQRGWYSFNTDDVVAVAYRHAGEMKGSDSKFSREGGLLLQRNSTSGGYANGRLYCRFSLYKSQNTTRSKRQAPAPSFFYPNTQNYYILIATGTAPSGFKDYHKLDKTFANKAVDFTSPNFEDISASAPGAHRLVKAHAILMIFAWMVFASFGVLLPKYYKSTWSGTKLFGKDIWFQLHQPAMILALCLTIAGFIIIFVRVDGWSQLTAPTIAHPPIGIIVMILALTNPIMAIFRCTPDDAKRPIFNVFHSVVGHLAHFAAIVAMLLGLYMAQLSLPDWCRWVFVAFICWHVFVEIVLKVHQHCLMARHTSWSPNNGNTEYTNQMNMEPMKNNRIEDNNVFKTLMLISHFIGVLGLAIAIAVQIGRS